MAGPIVVQTGSSPLKNIISLLVVGGIGFGAYKGYQYYKSRSDLNKQIDSTVKPAAGKKMFDLNGKPITSANLGTIAADIHSELDSYFPDNARVVRVFQSTPFGYVPQLEKFYLDQYGANLRDTLAKKLKDENWIKIKFNFK